MARNQPARRSVRSESIEEFMARRRREVASFGRAAEAAAHAAVGRAIRAGQSYRLSTPSEVLAGATLLGARRPQPTGKSSSASAARPARLDNSRAAKAVGGTLAYGAGMLPGAVRGAVHTGEGAVDGLYFGLRLANPILDLAVSPPGRSAREQFLSAGSAVADYAKRGLQDPAMVRRDVASAAHDFRLKQDPTATPVADTLGGEMKRTFNIGMNNGELAFDVGSLLVGGGAIKGAAGVGRLAKAADATELAYLARNPGFAARLEQPYKGMSHHIVPRSRTLPSWLGGRVPPWLMESEFNKIRHTNITTRDVYRNHVGSDKSYSGGKIGAKFGGGRWSAGDLGWNDYGPLDRLNYGTSPATKAVVGPVLVGGTMEDLIYREERR